MSTDRPAAFVAASNKVFEYIDKTRGEPEFRLFGKLVSPYPRSQDECWWIILLHAKPYCTMYATEGGDQPLISAPGTNKSQTPREECLLMKEKLRAQWDVDWLFDESAPEKEVTVVQV
jgi:hypothetical protein